MSNGGDVCRRRAADPRHPVRVPATIEASVTGDLPRPGRIVNLRRRGLALHLDEVLDSGAPVRITLHLHGRAALAVVGRVAWVDRAFTAGNGSAGVAFKKALTGNLVADVASEGFLAWEQQPDSSTDER